MIRYLLFVYTVLSLTMASAFALDYKEPKDPYENFNRKIHHFNSYFDGIVIKPVTRAYRYAIPKPIRNGIRNVVRNLGEPVTFINSALQGDVDNSFSSFWRFTINSTFGIGGIFDIMHDHGLPHRREDFGQTMAVHSVGDGAYIVIPIFGPSNVRDFFGGIVDRFMDPFNYVINDAYGILAYRAVSGIDRRESLLDVTDDLEENSLDSYATLRSLYVQRRAKEIANSR